ncbi:hypothetical protein O181_034332 [Austropuccinia psidii MF-1]|uniref:Uncharacterized protein n=1 Tax=Austropuccinia psidii MF-1 TaxID=1389203 RepID=A0A9Q3D314_9BASI|nr:hypothetical protein [Austropuccinia psidii MF-1]
MPPCTRLILSAAYHPYACGVPSRHASDATYQPYAHGVPSRHASNAAYHPYACIVPAQHASNASYHPYACSARPTCLPRCLPSLRLWSAFLTCLRCPPHTGLILKAAYDPYATAAPSR